MSRSSFTSMITKIAVGGALAFALSCSASPPNATVRSSVNARTDCPGKMICPMTGELICVDQCPLAKKDASRMDCPGQMVCPATGALICIDKCPVAKSSTQAADVSKAPCCSGCVSSSAGH